MKKSKKKILYVIFVLIMIVSGVVFFIEYNKEPEEPEIYKPTPSEIETVYEEDSAGGLGFKIAQDIDIAAERRKHNNNDIIGRLEIPDLFNVLVTKCPSGDKNKYYLDHSVDKTYDVRGTEFIDYRVTATSKQINVYGHNTRDPNIKVAFLKLEQLLDKSFFDKHPYIIFQYDGGKSLYEIKAIKEISDKDTEHMRVDATGQNFIDHVNKITSSPIHSRDIAIDENSEILVLQTCSHHLDNAFYIITAVKVDYQF